VARPAAGAAAIPSAHGLTIRPVAITEVSAASSGAPISTGRVCALTGAATWPEVSWGS
jgi:hypothetical protein